MDTTGKQPMGNSQGEVPEDLESHRASALQGEQQKSLAKGQSLEGVNSRIIVVK